LFIFISILGLQRMQNLIINNDNLNDADNDALNYFHCFTLKIFEFVGFEVERRKANNITLMSPFFSLKL